MERSKRRYGASRSRLLGVVVWCVQVGPLYVAFGLTESLRLEMSPLEELWRRACMVQETQRPQA